MIVPGGQSISDPAVLLEIINVQTEIAKLGIDLGGVMSLVVERIQTLTGASGAIVELAEGSEMVYRATAGIAQPQLGLRLNAVGSLSGLCIRSGDILCCDDSDTDERVDREACRKVGLRSMVVAPLSHNGTTVGVLKIASPQPHAFAEQEVYILKLMSGLIGAAMFHATKFEASELYHLATHDALTGLANRALFYDRFRQSLAQARRQATRVGILNFDMDGLKPINDHYGHGAGDAAIRETASRISGISRQSDTVARLGGDEFGALLAPIASHDSLSGHIDRIIERIRAPFQFEGRELPLDCSIGVSVFPEDGTEIATLMEVADQRMYEVKKTRKCR